MRCRYEWLDPSIKKTDWSREEDEKLLHLAKLMPTQWRTIAPIVGRTPAQCLERYQHLLDEAEQKGEGGDVEAGPTADDVRRLRPGEIDPDPETKPAKPDPVDMDEDEKEMLSEARARLANTQGKKAKRKARERQLAEARRLASVQKHRELKAAGIDWKPRLRRGEFDYNNEIPFQTEIPAGFYDVTEENEREIRKITRGSKEQFEGKTRAQIETENRKKDAFKKRQMEKQGMPPPPAKKPPASVEEPFAKRRKLNLPAPRLGEQELEEIVKISQSGEAVRHEVAGDKSNNALVGDYDGDVSQHFTAIRTAANASQTPMISSIVEAEAANLLALQKAQTPLLGGENVNLHEGGTGFEGKTPQRLLNAAATPARATTTPAVLRGKTPSFGSGTVSSTPALTQGGRTPRRDGFGINRRSTDNHSRELSDGGEDLDGDEQDLREVLDFGFSSLPKPKNEFEIVLPPPVADYADEDTAMQTMEHDSVVEDMADVERKRLDAKEAEQRRFRDLRSQPLKRDLPRPRAFPSQISYSAAAAATTVVKQTDAASANLEYADIVDRMVVEELWSLVQNDAVEYPQPNTTVDPRSVPPKSLISLDELEHARRLVAAELKIINNNNNYDTESDRQQEGEWLVKRDRTGRMFSMFSKDGADLDSLKAEYELLINLHSALTGRSAKLQDRLRVVLGGYISRSNSLQQQLESKLADYCRLQEELRSFDRLAQHESYSAIPSRLA